MKYDKNSPFWADEKTLLENTHKNLKAKHSYQSYKKEVDKFLASFSKDAMTNDFNQVNWEKWFDTFMDTFNSDCCVKSTLSIRNQTKESLCDHLKYEQGFLNHFEYTNPLQAHGLKDYTFSQYIANWVNQNSKDYRTPKFVDSENYRSVDQKKLEADIHKRIINKFPSADVFLWRSDTLKQSYEMPIGKMKIDTKYLPIVNSFHVFEKPLKHTCRATLGYSDTMDCYTDYIAMFKEDNQVLVLGNCHHFGASGSEIENGFLYDFDKPFKTIKDLSVPLLFFLSTKATETKFVNIPRAEKRRLKKLKVNSEDFKTSVVYLRRFKNKDNEYIPNATKESDGYRDRNGSWWVRGHMRNQWYGSENNRHQKLIFIDPFIKGQGKMMDKTYIVRH